MPRQITQEVTLHIKGGRATFDATGLHLTPWFARRRLEIPWANIAYVSTVPSVSRLYCLPQWHAGGWPITPTALRKSLRFYSLDVVLYDRADFLSCHNLLMRWWLAIVWLELIGGPDEDEKPDPSKAMITLKFRQRWLRKNCSSLLSALDIIDRAAKSEVIDWRDRAEFALQPSLRR